MQMAIDWLKANTWLADWLASVVAMLTLVGPAFAKFFKIKFNKESIDVVRKQSKWIGELLSFVLSPLGLVFSLVIELIGLIFNLWARATFGCLGLYSSAITVLILSIISRLRRTSEIEQPEIGYSR